MSGSLTRSPLRLVAVVLFPLLLGACSEQDQPPPSESLAEAMGDTALQHAIKHQDPKYVCPMHSQIVRDEEGSCPICGMDLVKQQISMDDHDDGPPIVRVRPETIQNMGVRTEKAEVGRLFKRIDTLGRVLYDEDAQEHVHPRAAGWVEKLYVRSEGERVKKGQRLLDLYAPDIVNAQEELLLSIRDKEIREKAGQKSRSRDLVQSSIERLHLFDVPSATIREVQKTGKVRSTVPVLAPRDGVVTRMGLRDGMYVTPTSEMFSISDVSKVWVLVDVFEHQMSWFEVGRPADITVPAMPGKTWEGKVDYIYPELDPMTRTLRVRLEFDNPEGELKPNMLAEATIWGGPQEDVLMIPRDAIIETGKRRVVVLDLGDGKFQPVSVSTGMWTADKVEVLSGLQAGAEVVVSGQFLIDSESNLQASFRRMQK